MEIFKKVPLNEIYDDLVMGQSPSSSTYNDDKKGLPFVQGNADMENGFPKIRIHTTDPKKLSQKGDILLSVRAPVGDLFKNNINEIAIGRGICAIKIKDNFLREYIFQYFYWDTKQFLKLQQGTTFTEIGKREVRNLLIPLSNNPAEIKSIATILSKVDKAIEATRQSIKAAEKLKKALMQNLLTGKLKPDGTWRKDNEFYEDEKFGKVPVGWEVKKLGEFGEFLNGVNFSKSQLGVGYPFVNLKDIYSNEEIDCEELDKVDVKIVKRLILKKGDIVFVRSSVKPSGIGWVSLFNGSEDHTIFCGFVIKYSFDQTIISPKYLNTLLLSNPIRNKIIALGQVVANTNINQRALKSLSVYFSLNIEEQLEINKRLKSVDSEIQSKQTKIRTLQRLKKSLMQNLLTGKIRLNVEQINKTISKQTNG